MDSGALVLLVDEACVPDNLAPSWVLSLAGVFVMMVGLVSRIRALCPVT